MVVYIHKSCIYLKIHVYIAIWLRIQGCVLRYTTTNLSFLPDTYQLSLSLSLPPALSLSLSHTHTHTHTHTHEKRQNTGWWHKIHISLTLNISHLKIFINKNIYQNSNENELCAMSAKRLHSLHILFLRGPSTRFQVMASSYRGLRIHAHRTHQTP